MPLGVSTNDEAALRSFCARIIGWAPERAGAVEHALRALELAATRQSPLVLLGDADLVLVARALHRRMLGAEHPFVVCDPRRGDAPASMRSPASYGSAVAAYKAADGGTLCVLRRQLPREFPSVTAMIRELDNRVQLVICCGQGDKYGALLAVLSPIQVPSLRERKHEIPRIVEEFGADAMATLSASAPFTSKDRDWVCRHCSPSLRAIEDATLRIIALRQAGSVLGAARLLGMSPASLGEWFERRRKPR